MPFLLASGDDACHAYVWTINIPVSGVMTGTPAGLMAMLFHDNPRTAVLSLSAKDSVNPISAVSKKGKPLPLWPRCAESPAASEKNCRFVSYKENPNHTKRKIL